MRATSREILAGVWCRLFLDTVSFDISLLAFFFGIHTRTNRSPGLRHFSSLEFYFPLFCGSGRSSPPPGHHISQACLVDWRLIYTAIHHCGRCRGLHLSM
jgi:hypothetical protein